MKKLTAQVKEIWSKIPTRTKEIVGLSVLVLALGIYIFTEAIPRIHPNQLQAVNDLIGTESNQIESTDEILSTEPPADEPMLMTSGADAPEPEAEPEIVEPLDPYMVVMGEFDRLKAKDADLTKKYFGESDVFTVETVADKLTATVISFVQSEATEEQTKIVIHVCALDYDKMKEASNKAKEQLSLVEENTAEMVDELVKKEVAKGVVQGNYDVHYNIPVIISDNQVVVTEELKQAITGNWYHGINIDLVEVDCPSI